MIPKSAKSDNKLVQRGIRTRNEILHASVDIASAEGLEGLTIGRLAKELKMSKSGLFAHFGSKEDLQIETVRRARDVFIEAIVAPADGVQPGLKKLEALLGNWIKYVSNGVFRGGCFFFAVSAEMDDRPGRVRDLIAHLTMSWVHVIQQEIRNAVDNGEFVPGCNVELLSFQLHGYVQEANWFYRLHESTKAFDFARDSIRASLDRWKATSEKQEN